MRFVFSPWKSWIKEILSPPWARGLLFSVVWGEIRSLSLFPGLIKVFELRGVNAPRPEALWQVEFALFIECCPLED